MTSAKIFQVNNVKGIYLPAEDLIGQKSRAASLSEKDGYFFKLIAENDQTLNRFYPLKDWHLSGLSGPAFVDIGNSLPIKPDLEADNYIGSVSDRDNWILNHFIRQYYGKA